jgi:hypothetical protein
LPLQFSLPSTIIIAVVVQKNCHGQCVVLVGATVPANGYAWFEMTGVRKG